MESKFIIFVVFATVAQSFFGRSSAIISESALDGVDKIGYYQNVALITKYEAFDPVYDGLFQRLARLISNTTVSSDDSAQSDGEIASVKASIDAALSAVLLATGSPDCPAAEPARTAAYGALEDGFSGVGKALELAESSHGSDTVIQMEQYRTQVQVSFPTVIFHLYDAINPCLNATSPEITEAIQTARNASGRALYLLANAVFNAFDAYADAVARGTADYSVLQYVESLRRNAKISLRTDVTNKFSLLKALYIYRNQHGTEVSFPHLSQIERAETNATYMFEEIVELFYDTVFIHAANITSGLGAVAQDDFTFIDVQEAKTVAKFKAASLQIMLATFPNDLSAVETANEQASVLIGELSRLYYEQIRTAITVTTNFSETIAKLEYTNEKLYDVARKYADAFIDLYAHHFHMTHQTKDLITKTLNGARVELENLADYATNASVFLAKAASKNETDGLVENISADEERAMSAARSVADSLLSARLIVLRSSN